MALTHSTGLAHDLLETHAGQCMRLQERITEQAQVQSRVLSRRAFVSLVRGGGVSADLENLAQEAEGNKAQVI